MALIQRGRRESPQPRRPRPVSTVAAAEGGAGQPVVGPPLSSAADGGTSSPPASGRAALLEEFGGSQLLLGDVRTGGVLLNAARHSLMQGVFGVSREQENLLTAVLAVMIAERAHRRLHRWLRAGPTPTLGDGLLAGGAVEELVCAIAGPVSRETPGTGSLLALALLAGAAVPARRKLVRTTSSSWHRLSGGFHHRYGWLVDPGHHRRQRALRRAGQGTSAWSS